MSKPFFSIIIPTLNEDQYLPQLLSCLVNQTFKNFEVIHVDGNSSDKTVLLASKYASSLDLQSINVERRNVSFQRNYGGKKAQASWLIFMDADNKLPDCFLQDVKNQIRKKQSMDAFVCWLDVKKYSIKYQSTVQLFNFIASTFNTVVFGSLIGIRKQAFKKVKFNEQQPYAEDSAFAEEITQAGYELKCLKNPRYITSMRRMEKEGLFKLSKTFLESRLHLLLKGDLTEFNKYPMLGGTFYRTENETTFVNSLKRLDKFFKEASQKQLQKAKRVWTSIISEN